MTDRSALSGAFPGGIAPSDSTLSGGADPVALARTIEQSALRVLDDERASVRVRLPGDEGSPLWVAMAAEDADDVGEPRDDWVAQLARRDNGFDGHSLAPAGDRVWRQGQRSHGLKVSVWPLAHEGRLVGVLETHAPADVLRSRQKALQALADLSGALVMTATRAAEAETSMRRTEKLLALASSPEGGQENALRSALRFCSQLLHAPILAWTCTSTADGPLFLGVFGDLAASKARALRRGMPSVTRHELEPPKRGKDVAARVEAVLGSEAWPIVCRKEALLVVCGRAEASDQELHVIRSLLEIVVSLAAAGEGVERKSRRLDIALGSAAHELRGPLAVSRGLLDNLLERDFASSEAWFDLLQRSRNELTHLLSICDTFLRWDMALEPPATTRADVRKVLEEIVEEVDARDAAGETIRIDCASDLRALADEHLLRVSVGNLVRNALDHSPDDRAVDLTAHRWGDRIAIGVTDQGPGISPADRETIFEPFTRTRASRAKGATGAGLGLFIARRLIEAQRGSIEVFVTDQGTTFRVLIPSAPKATAAAGRHSDIQDCC